MKKACLYLVIFLSYSCFALANFLMSNGNLSFYYLAKEKELAYLRGDASYPLDISRIRFYWIDREERVYELKHFEKEVKKISENILEQSFVWNDKSLQARFIASLEEDSFFLLLRGRQKEEDGGHLVVEFSPQQENRYLYLRDGILKYQNFRIQTSPSQALILLGKHGELSNFHFQELLAHAKKYRENRLYYVIPVNHQDWEWDWKLSFYERETATFPKAGIWEEEEEKAKGREQEIARRRESRILRKNLWFLEQLSRNIEIPKRISYARAKMSYEQKQQLLLLRALYRLEETFQGQRILEDINLRKREKEAAYYFYYAFEYAKRLGMDFDADLVEQRLLPQVLSLYDEMAEDGRLIIADDSLESYALYYSLLEQIETRKEFAKEKEFIQERKEKLFSYIQHAFWRGNALQERAFSDQNTKKNIQYLFLYPKEEQKKRLYAWYQNYVNPKSKCIDYGEKKIDTIHSLKMISLLYQYGFGQEADLLWTGLEQLIAKNQDYILRQYSLFETEENLELSSEAIFYYLKANLDREQYYGNER